MDDSIQLRKAAENDPDKAFAALVKRHIGLVYSIALRQAGDPADAEEITQAVFIILGKKTLRFRHDKALSSWLFQTTRLTASNFIRSKIRRQHRELEAYMQSPLNESGDDIWQRIAPMLDEAVAALGEKDRRAVILRFYQGRNLQEVGTALGASKDAAEKRVARALEKLRKIFLKHGVDSTAAAIAGAISACSVQVTPAGLTETISIAAIAKSTVASTSTATLLKGALKFMAWTKTKTAIVIGTATLLAAGTATVAVKVYLLPGMAEAHLRTVLHTPRLNNGIFDTSRIDSALGEFGSRREAAFAVLKEASGETNLHLVSLRFYDTHRLIREGAFYGMGRLGKSVPEIQPYLWSVAFSQSRRTSGDDADAFFALRQMGFQPEDMPGLIKLLSDPTLNSSILTMFVPEAVSAMIESNSLAAETYLPELNSLLNDPNPDTQFHAALALVKSEGATDPQIFPPLHILFQRPDDRHNDYDKMLAVQVLGKAGPVAKPLIPDLLEFSKSADEIGMQQMAYEAIARIEPDRASQFPEVAALLKQEQEDKMWERKWKSGSYTLDDLRAALKDPRQSLAAANRLAAMGPAAEAAVPDMIESILGQSGEARDGILADIHKIDPHAAIVKIDITAFPFNMALGDAVSALDKSPDTIENQRLWVSLCGLADSEWALPDEISDLTNNLASQAPEAYKAFVKDLAYANTKPSSR